MTNELTRRFQRQVGSGCFDVVSHRRLLFLPYFRNRTVGIRLGKGETLSEITSSMSAVAEGILTSRSAFHLAKKENVDCPTIEGIYKVRAFFELANIRYRAAYSLRDFQHGQVIHENADPLAVVAANMTRPLKPEVSPLVAEAAHHVHV